jgi:glucose/arabinose dehydrogenase
MIQFPRCLLSAHSLILTILIVVAPVSKAQINPNDYSYPMVNQSESYIFRVVKVVEGLKHPWSLSFLPNGDMLIVERPGRLRIVRKGVLDPEPVAGIPPVWYVENGGLLDVVVHPDFESNKLVYFTYAKPSDDGSEGTLTAARGRFDGRRLNDVEDIFVSDAWGERPFHFGSRIAFDGKGYVFISTGDRQLVSPDKEPREENPAQDISNHAGTIVRLHDDGRIPSDNPFVDTLGARPEIWSYGHRNVQGLTIDKESGEVWAIEHGPTGGDELNLISKGRNYGWPVIDYGTGRLTARMEEGMEQPVDFWTPSIAPSGVMIYYGDKFPEWRGDIFVGSLRGHELHRLSRARYPDGSYRIGSAEEPPLMQGFGRIRDVREGPDGYIYLVIDDHRTRGRLSPIVRLEPAEAIEFNPHYHPYNFGDEGGSAGRPNR